MNRASIFLLTLSIYIYYICIVSSLITVGKSVMHRLKLTTAFATLGQFAAEILVII